MPEKARSGRDPFTFSLDGLRTVAPFSAASAIAHDRINNAIDERLRRPHDDQPTVASEMVPRWGRFWLRALRRAA